MIRAPLLILAVFVALACGAPQRAATVPDLTPRRDRILELDEAITAAQEQLGAGAPVCADVCRLADDICRSRDDICRIAGEMPGDAWAAERCEAATTTCHDARDRCTACR